jgi:hypothetical protein
MPRGTPRQVRELKAELTKTKRQLTRSRTELTKLKGLLAPTTLTPHELIDNPGDPPAGLGDNPIRVRRRSVEITIRTDAGRASEMLAWFNRRNDES